MFTPTSEQEAIIKAARETSQSLMIQAYAGCAKTTTIELVAKALPIRPSLATAFNVKIKKDMEHRLPPHFNVQTLNGLGHQAWGRAIGRRCGVEVDKLGKLLKQVLKENPEFRDTTPDEFSTVLSLIRRARVVGLVPKSFAQGPVHALIDDNEEGWETISDSLYLDPDERAIWLAREVLTRSIKQSYEGVIDYDDQIYMSALFGGVFPKYPLVMVDEAQDLSPLNHIQVSRCALDRLIVVGDPKQAIYAFRGADSSSMDSLRTLRESWLDFPLSLTFRCPRVVVERQQSHAPGFSAHETNSEGEILILERSWNIEEIEAFEGTIAILCRNNAPLMAAALRIIKSGRGCTILGREIGKTLITLSKKIVPHDETSIEDSIERVNSWADREVSLARANEKEERVAITNDKRECLLAVLESPLCRNAGSMRQLLTRMFEGTNLRITLATGHKAKGLEWANVIHLDPFRVPSKYARNQLEAGNDTPFKQDLNLKYVIETRAQKRLIFASLEDMT